MKERPILFNGAMVRAIRDGRKTVTRRVMRVQPVLNGRLWEVYGAGWSEGVQSVPVVPGHSLDTQCPYGKPGDRLWVRETWQDVHPVQVIDRYSQPGRAGIPGPPGVTYQTIYRADGEYPKVHHTHEHPYRCIEPDPNHGFLGAADSGWTGWTPSIHMPRWASRILLEITAVRVERLQAITAEQAEAEGVDVAMCRQYLETAPSRHTCREAVVHGFSGLWAATGGDWAGNPWVWVVEFKRVQSEAVGGVVKSLAEQTRPEIVRVTRNSDNDLPVCQPSVSLLDADGLMPIDNGTANDSSNHQ